MLFSVSRFAVISQLSAAISSRTFAHFFLFLSKPLLCKVSHRETEDISFPELLLVVFFLSLSGYRHVTELSRQTGGFAYDNPRPDEPSVNE